MIFTLRFRISNFDVFFMGAISRCSGSDLFDITVDGFDEMVGNALQKAACSRCFQCR